MISRERTSAGMFRTFLSTMVNPITHAAATMATFALSVALTIKSQPLYVHAFCAFDFRTAGTRKDKKNAKKAYHAGSWKTYPKMPSTPISPQNQSILTSIALRAIFVVKKLRDTTNSRLAYLYVLRGVSRSSKLSLSFRGAASARSSAVCLMSLQKYPKG